MLERFAVIDDGHDLHSRSGFSKGFHGSTSTKTSSSLGRAETLADLTARSSKLGASLKPEGDRVRVALN